MRFILTEINCELIIFLSGVFGTISSSQVEQHLLQGKQLLAAGQLNDALIHYHAAVGEYRVKSLVHRLRRHV